MRCNETRRLLEELPRHQLPAPAREHLTACTACQAYEQDWQLVRAGLRMIAEEPVPEASAGFVSRVVRRVVEPSLPGRVAAQFWELVGRRVILVGSLLALTALMALLLPPSGPWRSPVGLDLPVLQTSFVTENDPVVPDDFGSNLSPVPGALPGEGREER